MSWTAPEISRMDIVPKCTSCDRKDPEHAFVCNVFENIDTDGGIEIVPVWHCARCDCLFIYLPSAAINVLLDKIQIHSRSRPTSASVAPAIEEVAQDSAAQIRNLKRRIKNFKLK